MSLQEGFCRSRTIGCSVQSCLRPCWLHPAVSQIAAHLLQRTNQAGRATTNKAPMLSASLMVSRLGGGGRSSAAEQHQKAGRPVRSLYYLAYASQRAMTGLGLTR